MRFEEKLKSLRVKRGITQENLADSIHVSRSAIAKYENGNGKPSKETLEAIALYFDIDVSELEEDLKIEKKAKNRKIILLISSIFAGLLVIFSIITVVLYNKAKFLTSGFNLYANFTRISFICLIFVGIVLCITLIISLIKRYYKKLHWIIFISAVVVSLSTSLIGYFTINSQYKEFSDFTVEKWAKASNDHNYRGLLINSFIKKYNILGYSVEEVEALLGKPDDVFTYTIETYPTQKGGQRYIYDLGFYEDYIDPTTFEIMFNSKDFVVKSEKVHH